MSWWTKKRIISEVKRLQVYWNMNDKPLQHVVDYIMIRPSSVGKDLYRALSVGDFPEIRKGV